MGCGYFVLNFWTSSSTFASATASLSYDYGRYSSPLTDSLAPGATISNEVIATFPAKIVTQQNQPGSPFPLVAAVHFPKVTPSGGIKLTVYVECKTAAEQAIAKKIFRSIRFGKR